MEIGNLAVKISVDMQAFNAGITKAVSKLESFGKKAEGLANKTKGFGVAMAGILTLSVLAFDKQAQAIGQVEVALASTGNAAGKTSEELQRTASELQKISTFGDEEILQKVTAQLLTFTNIAGEAFDRTQKAALDLATRLGGDLQGASIQLGKALNDPVANLSALSRSGIQFSETQKKVINELVATNRLAEAQTIILDELEKQYGGSAEAAAQLGLGPIKQLKNSFGDLLESIGEVVVNAINPFVKQLTAIVERFNQASDSTKMWVTALIAVGAAIPAILFGIGFLATTLIPTIISGLIAVGAALTTATGGISLLVAAIITGVVLIIKNWDEVKRFILDAIDKIIIQFAIFGIKMLETAKRIGKIFGIELKVVEDAINSLQKVGVDAFERINERAELSKVRKELKATDEAVSNSTMVLEENIIRKQKWVDLSDEQRKKILDEANAWEELNRNIEINNAILAELSGDVSGNLITSIAGYRSEVEESGRKTQELNDFLGDLIATGRDVETISFVDEEEISKQKLALEELAMKAQDLNRIIQINLSELFVGLGEGIGTALAEGTSVVNAIGGQLLNSLSTFIQDIGRLLVEYGTLAVAKGLIDKAIAIGGPAAIIAGVAAIAIGAALSATSKKIGKAASGGGASGAGSIASAGANNFQGSGVRNSIVESGSTTVSGDFVLRGSDLVLAFNKAQNKKGVL